MVESYSGHAVSAVWGEGVACHTILMSRGGAGQCHPGLGKECYPSPPLEDLKSTSTDRSMARSSPKEHNSIRL
ncbi:hypothetical protein B296_00000518 [Ensete ventricosum]|uniref:Uncharacterized protein n=1 Tax=Ensete ventricosum TaxID=4639 RepID=A0A427AU67_ENSVE|nr:hypothetical protein B296_00000518 [Ensete ventricosum]